MARSLSDEELQLKKRARRRLVGAIVLVSIVAVVLPMVLDSEPRPVTQNVEIQIPSPNSAPLVPKGAAGPATPATTQKAGEPAAVDAAPAMTGTASSKADGSPSTVAPVAQTSAPEKSADTPAQPKSEAKADAATSVAKAEAKAAASKPPVEHKPDPLAKADSKSATAKREVKAAAPVAKATSEAKHDAAAKADARATATPAKGASVGFVIQLAALADAAKARQLQQQVTSAGVKGYTEVIQTAKGPVTRVRAGPFPTRDAAEKARDRLKGAGLDGKVVPK